KVAREGMTDGDAATLEAGATTLEVAHEALLRRWPTLADLLREDRDALLLLDGVLIAAVDWDKAEATRKPDFLAHRGSRLSDAQTLASRGPDWAREIAPARAYLAACQAHETEQRDKQRRIIGRAFVKPGLQALEDGRCDHAIRLVAAGALLANDIDLKLVPQLWSVAVRAIFESNAHAVIKGRVTSAFSPDGKRVMTASDDGTACLWDAETG